MERKKKNEAMQIRIRVFIQLFSFLVNFCDTYLPKVSVRSLRWITTLSLPKSSCPDILHCTMVIHNHKFLNEKNKTQQIQNLC